MKAVFESIGAFYARTNENDCSDGADILKLLPYMEYEPVYGFHRLRNGKIAVAYLFDDVALDNELTMDGRVDKLNAVKAMINEVSPGTHMQVIKRINKNIRSYCNKLLETYQHGVPIARRVLEEDIKKVLSGAEEAPLFEHEQKDFWVKQSDNVITLVFNPIITKKDSKEPLRDGERNVFDHVYEREAKSFIRTCKMIEASLERLKANFKRMDGDMMQQYLEEWFNPMSSVKLGTSKYRTDIPQYQNILRSSPKRENLKGYTFEGKQSLVMSVQAPPEESTRLGLFGGEIFSGDSFQSLIDIINEGLIVFNIFVQDSVTSDQRIRGIQRSHVLGTKVSNIDIDATGQKIKDDCTHALNRIGVGKQSCTKTRVHIILRGEEEDNIEKANAVSSYISSYGMKLITELRHGFMLEEQCWPFNFSYNTDVKLMRTIDLIADNLACMLPIYGAKVKRDIAPIFFLSDRGYIYPWQPIRPGEANHIFIDGKTGSGKSVFGNRLMMGLLLNPDVIMYGIDVGASQMQLIQSCPGYKYDTLDPEKPQIYNPVFGPLNDVTKGQMMQRIALMIEGGPESKIKISSAQRQLIGDALKKSFDELRIYENDEDHVGEGDYDRGRDKILFRDLSELDIYLNRGDILGSEEYFAWFKFTSDMDFTNAKNAEKSESITTSYRLMKAVKLSRFESHWHKIIIRGECESREYNGFTYLLYDQEKRKNNVISQLAKSSETTEASIVTALDYKLAFAVYEVEDDIGQIEQFGVDLLEKEEFGEAYIQKEVRLSDVMVALDNPVTKNEELISISKKLAFELRNFCKGGEYGMYFDGYNTLEWASHFMGWEFKPLLARDEFVASLVLSSLLSQISIQVKDKKLKKYLKLVYLDETWQFVKAGGPIVMKVIEDAVRTWRKEGGVLIVSTQGINEIKEQEGGVDIYNQFAHFVHLRQDMPDEIISAGSLEGKQAEKFRKLEKASGKFSEGILMTGSTEWAKFRCILSPYTFNALAMDTDKVIGRSNAIKELMRKDGRGLTMEEAIIEAPALLVEQAG